MYVRGGTTMKPTANKMLYPVIALLFLLSLAMIPMPSEGKEQKAQETKSLPTLIEIGKRHLHTLQNDEVHP